jgi:cell division protein FtsI/penicillin-binding protein 2
MVQKEAQVTDQQESLQTRLPIVVALMSLVAAYLMVRLITLQYQPDTVVTYYNRLASYNYNENRRILASRGMIYDRDGHPLASNTIEYEIGISPSLVSSARTTATKLAPLLGLNELDILRIIQSDQSWASLAKGIPPEIAEQVRALDILGLTIDSLPKRLYPQGILGAPILGFMGWDDKILAYRGFYGVEEYYEDELAGRVRNETVSKIPFDLPESRASEDRGADLVLTIDRDIQFVVEAELQRAVVESGSTSGVIIVMDPRTGEILAMTNYPAYDPNAYYDVEDLALFRNSAISDEYEPGSIMKVLTMAAALQKGVVVPGDTYVDNGLLQVGGIDILNSDRLPRGVVDISQILVQSLNVGAATLSTKMGPRQFYEMMDAFGIGRATGIDLQGEASGTMLTPIDSDWSESNLATNSFGQGVAVTPLQILTAISAIANDGLMMQPHIVYQIVDGDEVYPSEPSALGRPISAETAQIVTDMMVQTVEEGLDQAQVAGYMVAGKSGTAQIATPLGYTDSDSIVSFVGFVPADEPRISILVKLDRPDRYWGSLVAAPVFSRLIERLVLVMEIPTDEVRQGITAQGGDVHAIWNG